MKNHEILLEKYVFCVFGPFQHNIVSGCDFGVNLGPFLGPKSTTIVTLICLRRVLGRLGGVLGRLVASWKCLGASEDRNYCL